MDVVNRSFVFAFARDPLERFYSSLAQASFQTGKENWTHEEVASMLERMRTGECGHDEHLESQASVLSTPTFHDDGKHAGDLPIDFIGRVSHVAEDFELMLSLAAAHTGRRLDEWRTGELLSKLEKVENSRIETAAHDHGARQPLLDSINSLRSDRLDRLVRVAWAQDFACFELS